MRCTFNATGKLFNKVKETKRKHKEKQMPKQKPRKLAPAGRRTAYANY